MSPLPSKAIWVATQDRIFQGKLDVQSLRAITGQIEAKLVIFVEDKFAKTWVEAILRQAGSIAMDHLQVHAMQGDGAAVAINLYHNKDPSVLAPSVCFLDGDSKQNTDNDMCIFRLPGESPEAYVFDKVIERWNDVGGKLSVALLQRFEKADSVRDVCLQIGTTNRDSHLLFSQIGERLGLLPENSVALAFANIWAQTYVEECAHLIKPIWEKLPKELS